MGGFAETHGLMGLEKDMLTVEFETKDSLFGVIKSGIKRIKIPISELEAVYWKKKVFGAALIIRARSLKAISSIPGNNKGEVHLKITRRDRDVAAQFASRLELRISEHRLDRLDHDIDMLDA